MKFGPDLNAYTSFDETVYMLQLPSEDTTVVETGLRILMNWAGYISFDQDEIDKERGVIVEEWRSRRGAAARINDQHYPVLFKDSKYAERLPIGDMDVVKNFERETLVSFYKAWYRPDLMAVIAVGDFDAGWMEQNIAHIFSALESRPGAPARKVFPVPDHQETLYSIASDPEASRSRVSLYHKQQAVIEKTVHDFRRHLVERLYHALFNERLQEITKSADPPFLFAYSGKGRILRSTEATILSAAVGDKDIERGLSRMLEEAARIDRHGFTQTEIERGKTNFLRSIERAFLERDKTESETFASEYVRHFLYQEPTPGIEIEKTLYQQLLPGISQQELNTLGKSRHTEKNRVVLISAPEKDGLTLPTESDLKQVFAAVAQMDIVPYDDLTVQGPLLAETPPASKIVSQVIYDSLNVYEWHLENGVRVVLKPTQFQNDQILFRSFSPGGHSLVADSHYVAGLTAATLVKESGVGRFSRIDLEKKLAGKVVSVDPYIHELTEGLNGSCSPQDFDTLLKLIYLYFTSPRQDSSVFLSVKNRLHGFIENRNADPAAAYSDTIRMTMEGYHDRSQPWSLLLLEEMDLNASLWIYQDRFADANDFTFFFVGNFSPDSIRSTIETYLGGLPAEGRQEHWRDVGVTWPDSAVEKSVFRGIEPKSTVTMIYFGQFEWNRQNRYLVQSLSDYLSIRLREIIREELSGTYGVRTSQRLYHYPHERYQIQIRYHCNPDRVEELNKAILSELEAVRNNRIDAGTLKKIKEQQMNQFQVNLRENSFWLNVLNSYYYHRQHVPDILTFPDLVSQLSEQDIATAAAEYLNTDRMGLFVLYPQQATKQNETLLQNDI